MKRRLSHRALRTACWLLGFVFSQPGLASCPLSATLNAEAKTLHQRAIEAHRRVLEETFSEPRTTPLLPEDIAGFNGLSFFPIDSNYHLPAHFLPSSGEATFELPTFNGERQRYSEFGTLRFCLESGAISALTLYRREDAGPLARLTAIAPFRDQTNGKETYSGGRYLKFRLPLNEPVSVDFNRAVNPYCAYNPMLPCPIPPRSNWLTSAIPAGEKDYVRP
jgi:hypothetical protein